MVLAGCCCDRNSVLELGSIPVPAHLCPILHGRGALGILPPRGGRQRFKWTVENNLNRGRTFPLHCNSRESVDAIPAGPRSAGTAWNVQQACSAEHELQFWVCSRAILSEPPEMTSLQGWQDQSCSLQPRSDFISVQFHPWAPHLEAEWSNSPNFLVGTTLTADLRRRGYLKSAAGNVSRCRRHELKD